MKYNIVHDDGEPTSATVFPASGEALIATRDHQNFQKIIDALSGRASGDISPEEEDEIVGLFEIGHGLSRKFERLSERITANRDGIYLDGVKVHNALTKAIFAFYEQGNENFRPLVNFMEKIETNPSAHSREHLYGWLEAHKFGIAEDGDIIAYKGVNRTAVEGRYQSSSSGYAIVNGEECHGRIPTTPGSIVEMPRDQVTADAAKACAPGLHAGNWRYASTFAPVTLRVKINPRDVVSVPTDSNGEKMRVCRYRVLDVVTSEDQSIFFPGYTERIACVKDQTAAVALNGAESPADASDGADATTSKPAPVKRKDGARKPSSEPAAKAKPKSKPKTKVRTEWPAYYEDFKKRDFADLPYNELRWLAKEWDVKVPAQPAKSTLVELLNKTAIKRRREIDGPKKKEQK